MTASEITAAVVRCVFQSRRFAVCPNVSWAMLPWEADILAIGNDSSTLHEIEVKVTASDLRRDFLKDKWGMLVRERGITVDAKIPAYQNPLYARDVRRAVHRFWHAVPSDLAEAATAQAEQVGAGVIVCRGQRGAYESAGYDIIAAKEREPDKWPGPREFDSDSCRRELHRLCALRFWDIFKNMADRNNKKGGCDGSSQGDAGSAGGGEVGGEAGGNGGDQDR